MRSPDQPTPPGTLTTPDYQALLACFVQATWQTNAQGEVVADAPAWRAYTGQTQEEWLAEGWTGAVHPDERLDAGRQWQHARSTQSLLDATYRLRRPDGSWQWANVRATPVPDADKRILKWVGAAADISGRKAAEEALLQDQRRLQQAFSIQTVGIIYFNLHGTITDANDAFLAMSGYNRQDCQKGHIRWDQLTPPEFMPVTRRAQEEYRTQGENTPYQKQYIRPDGSRWWGLFAGKCLGEDECVEFVLDITAQKQTELALIQSEARFRSIVEQAPMAIGVLKGPEMVIELGNETIFQLWGKDASITGKSLVEGLPEIQGQGFLERLQGVYTTGETHRGQAVQARLERQGQLEETYFDFTYTPLREADGSTLGVMVLAVEVTQQVLASKAIEASEARYRSLAAQLEQHVAERTQELLQANQDLTRSNANLQQFAYVASHDLQEPLRKIQAFSTLLSQQGEGQLTETGQDYISRINSASSRMSSLIRDLLNYSRVATRQETFTLISLAQIVAEVLDNLSLAIEGRGAQIQVDELPQVAGDASQVSQLMENLISNALKFTPPDQIPQVHIQYWKRRSADLPADIRPGKAAAYYHQISVVDGGVGFDKKYLDRIFQVFQRLHGKHEFPGTGVGLAICLRVVENHGGAITANSQPGQGATFCVYLPA
jgi:PAS domain S-box-containing protein